MGLKFRRRQKLFPGFYLNFSGSGISTTLGIKGLSVNLNKSGAYLNTGLPGTGLYDRNKITDWNSKNSDYSNDENHYHDSQNYFIPEKLKGEIESRKASEVTTQGLMELKDSLVEANNELLAIKKEIKNHEIELKHSKVKKFLAKIFILGFATKRFDNDYEEKKIYLENLKIQVIECHVDIEIQMERVIDEKYLKLKLAFEDLQKSAKIWDMTSSVLNTDNRSSATSTVARKSTKIDYRKIPFLNSFYEAMCFHNQNGTNIYIYPGFAAVFDNNQNFGLIELDELEISFESTRFIETEKIPSDSKVIGETWRKVNKDGTPDRRFKENYKIPIARYGELIFKSKTGVFEVFMFSNYECAQEFYSSYNDYTN